MEPAPEPAIAALLTDLARVLTHPAPGRPGPAQLPVWGTMTRMTCSGS